MLECYIELLIGCFISFKFYEIRKKWNYWDKFAAVMHYVGIFFVIAFFLFVCWFVFVKVVPLNLKKDLERKDAHMDVIHEADVKLKENQRRNNNIGLNRSKTL